MAWGDLQVGVLGGQLSFTAGSFRPEAVTQVAFEFLAIQVYGAELRVQVFMSGG